MIASGKIMNCDNYREAIAADPSESFEGGAAHAAVCESCSAYRAELQALDLTIARALAIDVPELTIPDLPPTGEEDGNVVKPPVRLVSKITTPAWIGLAASFALAAGIGVQLACHGPWHGRLVSA